MITEFRQATMMADGYLDALVFTEDHADNEHVLDGDDLSPSLHFHALAVCSAFLERFADEIDACQASFAQMGYDLWLTRNGHGTGFWDHPEYYPDGLNHRFSKWAADLGEVMVYSVSGGGIIAESGA